MKAALIVGHNKRAKGACSPYLDECEWDYNKPILERAASIINSGCSPHEARVFLRNPDASGELKDVAGRVDEWGPDATVSAHYNSFHLERAHGSEVFYWHTSEGGQRLAENFLMQIKATLSLSLRGLKGVTPTKNRRARITQMTNAPHVLVEPFFGSNENDAKVGDENREALAQGYADALLNFFS